MPRRRCLVHLFPRRPWSVRRRTCRGTATIGALLRSLLLPEPASPPDCTCRPASCRGAIRLAASTAAARFRRRRSSRSEDAPPVAAPPDARLRPSRHHPCRALDAVEPPVAPPPVPAPLDVAPPVAAPPVPEPAVVEPPVVALLVIAPVVAAPLRCCATRAGSRSSLHRPSPAACSGAGRLGAVVAAPPCAHGSTIGRRVLRRRRARSSSTHPPTRTGVVDRLRCRSTVGAAARPGCCCRCSTPLRLSPRHRSLRRLSPAPPPPAARAARRRRGGGLGGRGRARGGGGARVVAVLDVGIGIVVVLVRFLVLSVLFVRSGLRVARPVVVFPSCVEPACASLVPDAKIVLTASCNQSLVHRIAPVEGRVPRLRGGCSVFRRR